MNIVTMQALNLDDIGGGAYQKYMELISGCLDHGWHVYHISPRGFNAISHENLTHIGISKATFRPIFLSYSLQVLIQLLFLGRASKIDTVLVFSPLEGLIGLAYRHFNKNARVIVGFHGDQIAGIQINDTLNFKTRAYIRILDSIERLVVNRSDLLVFVSRHNRDNVLCRTKSHSAGRSLVIYNNINTRRIAALGEAKKISTGDGNCVIGFVGNLFEKGKGLGCLIESFSIVKKKIPGAKLVIVGNGPDGPRLVASVKALGLQDDVIFTGYQANPLRYMKGFDLMVLPSMHEGFPLVILEALAVGTPVIASNVGGIPELLEHDKLLFRPGDPGELASKIIDIFQNPGVYDDVRRLCDSRRQIFEFSWTDEMIRAVEKIRV